MERQCLLLRVKKIYEWPGCRNFFIKCADWWFVLRSSPIKIYSSISFCCHKPLKDWNLQVFLGKKSYTGPHLIFHFKWHSHWKLRRSINSLKRCAKNIFFKLNFAVTVQKGLKLPCKNPSLQQKMMTRDLLFKRSDLRDERYSIVWDREPWHPGGTRINAFYIMTHNNHI